MLSTPLAGPREMPSLPNLSFKLPSLNPKLRLGSRSGPDVVGLDIQPGFAVAVQAKANGSILAERAACLPLAADAMREGEVLDQGALSDVLRELFSDRRLSKRVRVGVANQRTVMRTLELPPVTDQKQLAAAVSFQAQDQVPMPLSNAVLDFHPLGIVETPSGPRQHVVLVAAQRDMVENLLGAVRAAGLQPMGIDLSAFALIRSLYRPEPDEAGRVVYLNVDGLTNLAIAEGTTCRFTRVVGGGLEGMAGELAERLGIPLADARALLFTIDLGAPAEVEPGGVFSEQTGSPHLEPEPPTPVEPMLEDHSDEPLAPAEDPVPVLETPVSAEDHEALEHSMTFAELSAVQHPPYAPEPASEAEPEIGQEPLETLGADADARKVLENGVREISGEVRNSLDFHRSQEGGGEVSHVVLSGSALDVPGFADALQRHMGLDVRAQTVDLADGGSVGSVSMHRLAVAAGLTAEALTQ